MVIYGLMIALIFRFDTDEKTASSGFKSLSATISHISHPYQALLIPLTMFSGLQAGYGAAEIPRVGLTGFMLDIYIPENTLPQ